MSDNQQRKPLKEEKSWERLQELFNKQGRTLNMKQLFASDASRFAKYSHRLNTNDGEILFDFSKNIINEEILNALLELVRDF
jgi:glucose-6-phosphate isomerase